jgi:hypothetical protein
VDPTKQVADVVVTNNAEKDFDILPVINYLRMGENGYNKHPFFGHHDKIKLQSKVSDSQEKITFTRN